MPTEEKTNEPEVECPSCGDRMSTSETLIIRGQAMVQGKTSIRAFHDHGVVWEKTFDSENEEFHCPYCGKWFSPNFVELRQEWQK